MGKSLYPAFYPLDTTVFARDVRQAAPLRNAWPWPHHPAPAIRRAGEALPI